MFCPRCGRNVSDTANFCGGCGLPKAEILKYNRQMSTPEITPAPEVKPVSYDELDSTVSQLEAQLKNDAAVSVTDYTTEQANDTNTIDDVITPSDFVQQEIKNEQTADTGYGQSQYSYQAPEYPVYHLPESETAVPEENPVHTDFTLSTVDYIWMMLIASVPVIGFVYLMYTAFAAENPNKRSYARAVLIIGIFACLIATVFAMGLIMSQLAFLY